MEEGQGHDSLLSGSVVVWVRLRLELKRDVTHYTYGRVLRPWGPKITQGLRSRGWGQPYVEYKLLKMNINFLWWHTLMSYLWTSNVPTVPIPASYLLIFSSTIQSWNYRSNFIIHRPRLPFVIMIPPSISFIIFHRNVCCQDERCHSDATTLRVCMLLWGCKSNASPGLFTTELLILKDSKLYFLQILLHNQSQTFWRYK